MDLKGTYNLIADKWSQKTNNVEWLEDGIDFFISKLKKGSTVLDVGCGTGNKSAYLLDRGLSVEGIDFSEKMIEIARRDVPGATFDVMDLVNVDNLNKKYDGIFARAVLLHFTKKDIPSILKKLRNLLNDGGYMYVAVKEQKDNEKGEMVVKDNDYGFEVQRFFVISIWKNWRVFLKTWGWRLFSEQGRA